MTINSVNTNSSALTALQNLNATNAQLNVTQTRISTGLKVSGAKDNGAVWSIAQGERSTISALDSVTDSLNRASSTVDVAVSAGQTISDLLNQAKAKALAATDATLTSTSVAALNNDYQAIIKQISSIVSNADFDGANLIKTGGTSVQALANASGTNRITVGAVSLAVGGANITFTANSSFTSASTASAVLGLINTSITKVNAAVAKLGTSANELSTFLTFVGSQQDTLTTGVGNLVDANVAKESANLTALQTKQQLGVQALSIANQGPQFLLSLFK